MMEKRIIYQKSGSPTTILIPCECGLTLEQIGKKDVPTGVPFWIVDAADIPSDRVFRDAWELDEASMGEPSGFGGEA
jgi:hypothetical protein